MFYRALANIVVGSSLINSSGSNLAVTEHFEKNNSFKVPNTASSFWYAKDICVTNNPHYHTGNIYDSLRGLHFNNVLIPKNILENYFYEFKFIGSYLLAKTTHGKIVLIQANSQEHKIAQRLLDHTVQFKNSYPKDHTINNKFLHDMFCSGQYIVARNKYTRDGKVNAIYKVISHNLGYRACIANDTLWLCRWDKKNVYNIRDIFSTNNRILLNDNIFCCGTDIVEQFVNLYCDPEYSQKIQMIKNITHGGEISLDSHKVLDKISSVDIDQQPIDYSGDNFIKEYKPSTYDLYRIVFIKNNKHYDTVGYFSRQRYYYVDMEKINVVFVDEEQFNVQMKSPTRYAFIREFNDIQLIKCEKISFLIDRELNIGNTVSFF